MSNRFPLGASILHTNPHIQHSRYNTTNKQRPNRFLLPRIQQRENGDPELRFRAPMKGMNGRAWEEEPVGSGTPRVELKPRGSRRLCMPPPTARSPTRDESGGRARDTWVDQLVMFLRWLRFGEDLLMEAGG